MSRRGHTLYELMISLALISALSGFTALLVAGARANDRTSQDHEERLRHVRRASDLLAAQIRGAAHVESHADGLHTDGVRWHVRGDALHRDDEVVVRGIARLEAENSAPRVWAIALAPMAATADRPIPPLRVRARQRVEQAR